MRAVPAPAATAALSQATKRWPARSRASDGIVGDAAHRTRQSDHNPDPEGYCCAFDLTHDPAHGVDAHALADELRFLSKLKLERRVKYVISRRRIARPPEWEWERYNGDNPHVTHIHVSITQAGKFDASPWWAGGAQLDREPVTVTGTLLVGEAEGMRVGTVSVGWEHLDNQGRGWLDVAVPFERVVGVIAQGSSPPEDGYWAPITVTAQPRGQVTRLTLAGEPGQGGVVYVKVLEA